MLADNSCSGGRTEINGKEDWTKQASDRRSVRNSHVLELLLSSQRLSERFFFLSGQVIISQSTHQVSV